MEPSSLERTLAAAIVQQPAVLAGYLFGSYADGRAHRESDIDVALLLDRSTHPTARSRFEARLLLIAEVAHALHRNDVDVVILNDAPPTLARAILTQGRKVICRDAEAEHAFVRTTLLRAADLDPFLRRMRARKLTALRQ
jgi:predicted nucleotidyltransferase